VDLRTMKDPVEVKNMRGTWWVFCYHPDNTLAVLKKLADWRVSFELEYQKHIYCAQIHLERNGRGDPFDDLEHHDMKSFTAQLKTAK